MLRLVACLPLLRPRMALVSALQGRIPVPAPARRTPLVLAPGVVRAAVLPLALSRMWALLPAAMRLALAPLVSPPRRKAARPLGPLLFLSPRTPSPARRAGAGPAAAGGATPALTRPRA